MPVNQETLARVNRTSVVFAARGRLGLAVPDVEAITKSEPETLVVRVGFEERQWLMEDAPETDYITDYYRSHPVVLVRLSRIDRDALRDLLSVSWRLTSAKAGSRAAGRSVRVKIRPTWS